MRQTNKAKALCLPVYALLIRKSSLQFVTCMIYLLLFFITPVTRQKIYTFTYIYIYLIYISILVHTHTHIHIIIVKVVVRTPDQSPASSLYFAKTVFLNRCLN